MVEALPRHAFPQDACGGMGGGAIYSPKDLAYHRFDNGAAGEPEAKAKRQKRETDIIARLLHFVTESSSCTPFQAQREERDRQI